MAEQIEKGVKAFDLVDHDRLPQEAGAFRVRKNIKFTDFKEMVRCTAVLFFGGGDVSKSVV